tara:strand:- start:209 stop:346 length:138 start_codon:yes stop_codon:yes gene_type:complete
MRSRVASFDDLLKVTMNLIGRTSMMAFVFMASSYFVTGQIIPGVV